MELVAGADPQQESALRTYLGNSQFDAIRGHAYTRNLESAPRGNVVVLHGIMGGELELLDGSDGDLIWVQILRLIAGEFMLLPLDANGASVNAIKATGLYMRFYGSLLTSLAQDWTARGFGYDWRLDIRESADALRHMIDSTFGPDAPVNLVAHSMGGLVARSYIQRHPGRWAKGGRLVMLGTPNYGSFAVPLLLDGINDGLKVVNTLDLLHSRAEILNVAKTFTAAYQMLPALGKANGLEPLYRASTYTVTPIEQQMLDRAAAFIEELRSAVDPKTMVNVVGYNRPTPCGIRDVTRLAYGDGFLLSKRGDGTVPHDLGLIDGVATFYVDEEHMNLPANQRVQNALTELLETGTLQNEANLYRGLGNNFDEGQSMELLMGEGARIQAKAAKAAALREAVVARGPDLLESVPVEEMALADLLLAR